jgi:hypothetical protein
MTALRRRWRAWGSIVPIAITLLIAAPTVAAVASHESPAPSMPAQTPSPEPAGEPSEVRFELVEQRFAIDPNGDIQLHYLLTGLTGDPLELLPPEAPPEPPSAPAGPDATLPDTAPPEAPPAPEPAPVLPDPLALTIEVTNYRALTDPDDLDDLVGSDVDPDAFTDVVDGVALDARPLMTRNDDGTVELTLVVGTDVVDSIETRLKMEQPGIYPLRVQLLVGDPTDDDVVATAGTVVQRLAGAVDANVEVPPAIDLSVVTVTPGPPPEADGERLRLARERLDQSIDLAAALDNPVTLEVPPTLIADLAATPDGAEQLAASLAGDELVALPIVPLDVSSAVAVDRADIYTRLVRAGEELLTEAVPSTPSRRDVWMTTDPLSGSGAQLLRDLGTRFVVIPAQLYEESIGGDLPPSDQFVDAELPDGGTLPFLVVGALAEQLTKEAADRILSTSTPTEWGVETIARMLIEQADDDAARSTASTSGPADVPTRRSRVVTTPDLSSPDVRLVQALEALATTTPAVRFTAASALTGVTDVLVVDGDPVTIQLPAVEGPSLAARVELLDATRLQLDSAASMLPADDPRPAEWSLELDALISTGYSDPEVEEATSALLAGADIFKQAVELPEPFRFTLTGRRGTIEIRLGNTLDEPLDVLVTLESTKIDFPEGDQRVTLRPLGETSVIVPVDAEANGTSSINLVVSTPAGEPIDQPVTLTARVTALTGLGQVLTGGFILVLLTWWFTHWRGRRRAELADDGRERHPSNGKVESGAL